MKINLIAVLLLSTCFISAQTTTGEYKIKNLSINTKYSDFGTTYFGDSTIIFSSPSKKTIIKNIWKPNQQSYLDLYTGDINSQGEIINKKRMSKNLNSKFHEAQLIFTKDKKTVFFTRNNYFKGEEKNDSTGILKLQLFKATVNKEGVWSNVEKLPFNSDQYSTGHPALSPDESQLYFVSDRPGSFGKTDIYVVTINSDGTYTKPQNLGENINTIEKEMFPFMSEEKILYFSSEGYNTIGGLDIYASKKYTTTYSKPLNLGEPINSQKDDFALISNRNNTRGYFSSNRKQGKGDDDIYGYIMESPLSIESKQMIEGLIANTNSEEFLSGVKVMLLDQKGNVLDSVRTNEKGAYNFKVEIGASYSIKVVKDNFIMDETPFTVPYDINDQPKDVSFSLKPDINHIIKNINIDPIYFELNKTTVSTAADQVVAILKKYPQVSIEAYSHTDSRSSKAYNIRLSKKRAKAVEQYLVERGIELKRIKSYWFGEEKLKNQCASGVKCIEEEHQMNRRTEFIIIKN